MGKDILGKPGFDFDIEIHLGAGAYVCGEESALIESLEGKRGITRKRPPFPVTSGYLGLPTVVNNVETFLAAARIVERGGDWFRAEGTDRSTGSRILCVCGDVARPGIYEYPFGIPISPSAGGLRGFQSPGGASLRRCWRNSVPVGIRSHYRLRGLASRRLPHGF